jgi:hypothetical protein
MKFILKKISVVFSFMLMTLLMPASNVFASELPVQPENQIYTLDNDITAEVTYDKLEEIQPKFKTVAARSQYKQEGNVTFKHGIYKVGTAKLTALYYKDGSNYKLQGVTYKLNANKGVVKSDKMEQKSSYKYRLNGTMTYLYSAAAPGYYYLMKTNVDINLDSSNGSVEFTPNCSIIKPIP